MGRKQGLPLLVVLAGLFAWSATVSAAGGDGIPRLTKDELQGLLGNPDVVILDVRFDGNLAPSRVPGAVHEDPGTVDSWAGKYPREKRIVLYCS